MLNSIFIFQVECNLQLPGFSELHYPIQNARLAGSGFDSSNKILHYYLECFHQYYNAEFMLQIVSYVFRKVIIFAVI